MAGGLAGGEPVEHLAGRREYAVSTRTARARSVRRAAAQGAHGAGARARTGAPGRTGARAHVRTRGLLTRVGRAAETATRP
ncbi:hypothetical protein DVA86_31320 [Streptomyces armeniacus]|uniref:Uncharacterized protein n=2 Tax=Streptomyces armeniacus TaxID=83291 RepID=A0A345XXP3_9ACTN|nr:hypothetical protein DVA86_31320 [Streptomyces armeniacus]